jgi:hypothetical protein
MRSRLAKKNRNRIPAIATWLAAWAAGLAAAPAVQAADWCSSGLWVDAMIGSLHVNPQSEVEGFNPGLGVECWISPGWAVTAGGFRNSLRRGSWYGGGIWAPEFAHWGFVRLAAMAGIISGYNYDGWGFGPNHSIGPVVVPVVMVEYRRVGVNFILVPPIPSSDLPFTVGFQLRVRF